MPRGQYDRKKSAKARKRNLRSEIPGVITAKKQWAAGTGPRTALPELPLHLLNKAERLLDAIADDGSGTELINVAAESASSCIVEFRKALVERKLVI